MPQALSAGGALDRSAQNASAGTGTGAYTVRTGDSLQTIAQAAYGDSQLWYLIADATA